MRFIFLFCSVALFAGFAASASAQPFPFGLVKDLRPGSGDGLEGPFIKLGDKAYFWGNAPETGEELWVTDGTEAGTHIVADLIPGTGGEGGGWLFEFKGKLFFPYQLPGEDTRIFVSDGAEAGTMPFYPDLSAQGSTLFLNFIDIGEDHFYFSTYGPAGGEPYVSDGTVEGTGLLKEINPTGFSSPQHPHIAGNTLYFSADDGVHGLELWRSQGTEETTEMVLDYDPGAGDGYPYAKHWDGSRLFAVFNDPNHGEELFVSDPAVTTFTRITDLRPGPNSGLSTFAYFASFKGEVFFTGYYNDQNFNEELFKTDGTAEGTEFVAEIFPGPDGGQITNFVVHGDYLYFNAASPTVGYELFRTDGTGPGTTHVTDLTGGENSSNPNSFTLISDPGFEHYGMFILGMSNGHGQEPYLTDGTPAVAILAADISSGPADSSPSWMTFLGEKLIFHARLPGHGFELYSMALPRRASAQAAWLRYR